jgi:hypothetical protein
MAAPTNWLADAAAKARDEQGPVITGSMNRSLSWACPLCTDVESKLIQIAGQQMIVCETNGAHRWRDTAEQNPLDSVTALDQIRALNPKPLSSLPKREAPQANREPLTFPIHKQLKADLEAKFGDKLNATLAAMCQLLLDPHAFAVDGENAKRMKELFPGQKISDGGTLYGLLFAQARELEEFRETEKERERQRLLKGEASPASPSDIVLRMPADVRQRLQARAAELGKTPDALICEQMPFWLDNGWL